MESFRTLSKVHFVWQYNGPPLANLPPNVFTAPWLPQQDLLGHVKCKSFVTLGGLASVVESMWHGVPVVGIPIFADFKDNVLRVTDRDGGIMLDKKLLNEKTLTKAIRKVQETKSVLVFFLKSSNWWATESHSVRHEHVVREGYSPLQ